jgi:parallel beta helix pectate lyase-like protein
MKKYCLLLALICTPSVKATLSCLPPQDGENLWRLVSQFYDCFSDLDADIASTVDIIVADVCSCVETELTSLVDSICSCVDVTVNSVSDVIQTTIISEGDAVCSCVDATVNSATDVITSELEEIISCLIGTPITNASIGPLGLTISAPGLYYLCETINYTGLNPVITIISPAQDVTLDLGGHAILTQNSRGIEVHSNTFDIVIKNGIIDANPTGAATGREAIALLTAEGVYISDIVVDFAPDVAFLISNSVEVTIDRCHFDGSSGFITTNPNPGKILINGSSNAIIVRDCDVYNPFVVVDLVNAGLAGYSVDIIHIIGNKGEIRFERCYVRSDQFGDNNLPLTPFGFFISGVVGSTIVQKDCSASFVQTGFYDTTKTVTSTGEPLLWDSCVATSCTTGFFIDDAGSGNPPTDKTLLRCVASNNSGDGFKVNNALDVVFRGCIAQQNGSNGFEVIGNNGFLSSNIFFEECIASFNTVDGFALTPLNDGGVSKAGFRFCTATGNGAIGFDCTTGTFVLIKDCLATENNNQGINLVGVIAGTKLDTRSGITCTGNGAADSLGVASEVNYCDVCA